MKVHLVVAILASASLAWPETLFDLGGLSSVVVPFPRGPEGTIDTSNVISPLPADELQYHGTTCLSFVFSEGVIVAVDSRASIGKYVGSRTTRKVFPMSRHVVATMAGGAADCTYWIRHCACVSRMFEYRSGAPLSVASIATVLARNLREWRQASKYHPPQSHPMFTSSSAISSHTFPNPPHT